MIPLITTNAIVAHKHTSARNINFGDFVKIAKVNNSCCYSPLPHVISPNYGKNAIDRSQLAMPFNISAIK